MLGCAAIAYPFLTGFFLSIPQKRWPGEWIRDERGNKEEKANDA
jgi:hypothetical protein